MPDCTEPDQKNVLEFMHAHPFVTLIGNDGNHSAATQVPVLIEKREGTLSLRGHLMKKTDHHTALLNNPEVLVLFMGPQCYVSSSWYSERGTGGTWNEITVQSVEPIFKLSQNKEDDTYEKIVNELNSLNDYSANEIADEMVKRRPHLFSS